jgi:hypothetical protein
MQRRDLLQLLGGAAASPTILAGHCFTAYRRGQFENTPLPASVTGSFGVEFDAVATHAPMDGVYMLSGAPVDAFADSLLAVRFSVESGLIQALNGSTYSQVTQLAYAAGAVYHFRIQANIATRRYSVWVRRAGGAEVKIADGFAFRTGQRVRGWPIGRLLLTATRVCWSSATSSSARTNWAC